MNTPKIGEVWRKRASDVYYKILYYDKYKDSYAAENIDEDKLYWIKISYDSFCKIFDADGTQVISLRVGCLYMTNRGDKAFCCFFDDECNKYLLAIEKISLLLEYNNDGTCITPYRFTPELNIVGECKE